MTVVKIQSSSQMDNAPTSDEYRVEISPEFNTTRTFVVTVQNNKISALRPFHLFVPKFINKHRSCTSREFDMVRDQLLAHNIIVGNIDSSFSLDSWDVVETKITTEFACNVKTTDGKQSEMPPNFKLATDVSSNASLEVNVGKPYIPPAQTGNFFEPTYKALFHLIHGNHSIQEPDIPPLLQLFGPHTLSGMSNSHFTNEALKERAAAIVRYNFPFTFDEIRQNPYLIKQYLKMDHYQFTKLPTDLQHNPLLQMLALECNTSIFNLLPKDSITKSHCEFICKNNAVGLSAVQDRRPDLIDNELIYTACSHHGHALKYVPEKFKEQHPDIYQVAMSAKSIKEFDTNLLPKSVRENDKEFHEKLLETSGLRIRDIPQKFVDEKMCIKAYQANPSSYQYFPEKFKTEALTLTLIQHDRGCLSKIPHHLNYSDFWFKACKTYPHAIDSVPRDITHEWSSDIYLELAGNPSSRFLKSVPTEKITPEICETCCQIKSENIKFVPKKLKTDELQTIALLNDPQHIKEYDPHIILENLELVLDFVSQNDVNDLLKIIKNQPNLPAMLYRISILSTAHLLKCLTHNQISFEVKEQLLSLLHKPVTYKVSVQESKLCSDTDPLILTTRNPVSSEFNHAVYQATSFKPPQQSTGEELETFIAVNTPEAYKTKTLDPIPKFDIIGGRTLHNEIDGEHHYFKLQRKDESLPELSREGLTHQFLAQHSDIKQRLKSKLPEHVEFSQVPYEQVQDLVENLEDQVRIMTKEGKKYVNVYQYKATENYFHYCHKPKINEPDPQKLPTDGLMNACHDIGLLLSMGITLTSVIPAFHCSSQDRRWLVLQSNFAREIPHSQTGVFKRWAGAGTEKADFCIDGLRDIGDSELFGRLKELMKNNEVNEHNHPPAIMQRLIFNNSMQEAIIAVILLRSRLFRERDDYHYKNENMLAETQHFIESCFNSILNGYTGLSDTNHLKALLNLSKPDFQSWLLRCAQEILYWTAKQPYEDELLADPEIKLPEDFLVQDAFASHLQNGTLSTSLYSSERPYHQRFPNNFSGTSKQLHLGERSGLFPLISLIRGMTLFSARFFEKYES